MERKVDKMAISLVVRKMTNDPDFSTFFFLWLVLTALAGCWVDPLAPSGPSGTVCLKITQDARFPRPLLPPSHHFEMKIEAPSNGPTAWRLKRTWSAPPSHSPYDPYGKWKEGAIVALHAPIGPKRARY